jgi:hypothetical protein
VAPEPIPSTDPVDESDGDDPGVVVEADDSSATEQAAEPAADQPSPDGSG